MPQKRMTKAQIRRLMDGLLAIADDVRNAETKAARGSLVVIPLLDLVRDLRPYAGKEKREEIA